MQTLEEKLPQAAPILAARGGAISLDDCKFSHRYVELARHTRRRARRKIPPRQVGQAGCQHKNRQQPDFPPQPGGAPRQGRRFAQGFGRRFLLYTGFGGSSLHGGSHHNRLVLRQGSLPGLAQFSGRAKALGRVLCQRFGYHLGTGRRQIGAPALQIRRRGLDMHQQHRHRGGVRVRQRSGEHLIQHNPQRIHIAAPVGIQPLALFRAGIRWRAHELPGGG